MNKSLIVIAILCTGLSVNCVQVENLCQSDVWTYKYFNVNSVYKLQQNLSMIAVNNFAIDEHEEFVSFQNQTLRDTMLDLKQE